MMRIGGSASGDVARVMRIGGSASGDGDRVMRIDQSRGGDDRHTEFHIQLRIPEVSS
jgi:hypothetical protein